MVKITFVEASGLQHVVEVEPGISLMKAAVTNGVAGIVAACGGACMCATCHVILDDHWLAKSGSRTDLEHEMLPFAIEPGDHSRLSCQINVTADLDGMVVNLPERQL